jgi:hypothetical protein
MQFAKKTLMVLVSLAVLVALVSLAVPKSVHALVATLVQVANTTTNPVVAEDADRATRIPYQSSSGPPGSGCYLPPLCLFNAFTPAPAGYRLVVQNISAQLVVKSGTPLPSGFINSSGDQLSSFIGTYAGDSFAVINQQITSYHNAGDSPSLIITADWYGLSSATVTLSGYIENCSVTGCPPVQH